MEKMVAVSRQKGPGGLVSIGMPVYNGEPFIREALESVLAQTFTDFELVISDNASTDKTEAICREYAAKDARIRYVRQTSNIGPSANFQFVLDEAIGVYFMWAAADDVLDAGWLLALLNAHLDDSGLCVAFGKVTSILRNGEELRRYPALRFSRSTLLNRLRYFLLEDTQGKANLIYGLYRRSELKKIGFKMRGSSPYGQDMLIVFRCLELGFVAIVPEVILYKRFDEVVKRASSRNVKTLLIRLVCFERLRSYTYYLHEAAWYEKPIYVVLLPCKYLHGVLYRFFIVSQSVRAVLVTLPSRIRAFIKKHRIRQDEDRA